KGKPQVHVQMQLLNSQTNATKATVTAEILSPDGEEISSIHKTIKLTSESIKEVEETARVSNPQLWSPELPNLYKLITTVESGGKIVDRKEMEFGIRTIAFSTKDGFLLNGKRYQIQGTCNHQDHAGVGSAIPDDLQDYRVARLKEMGCNAIRTSHNPPTPELLDACDRLGLLIMDENRRMDTNDYELNELKNFILRDRNHPSVFIWSLGNEEMYLQGTRGTNETTPEVAHTAAVQVVTPMQNLAHELDPTRLCTVAMNGGWGYGFSTVIDVQGFNYRTRYIDEFHQKFPNKPTIGTETASTRITRGIYADDKARGYVAAYGSNGVERAQQWWPYYATHPFTGGGFVWTGFDYRGEPTPYKWPCISSHFGLMDTCGFPKDLYYYYQAWWTGNPVLRVMPHWNWPDKIGQNIDARVFSNCKQVELFLNGQSLGKQTVQPNWFLDWQVPYQPGTLAAKGYDENGQAVSETDIETTGDPAAVELEPDRTLVNADGESLSIINVSIRDLPGHVVPTATNLVYFAIQGPGKIIGVGNGDPSCHEPDQYPSQTGWQRSAFNGLAQVIVQSTKIPGEITVTATADGLQAATVYIQSQSCTPRPYVP
ncbi:MAG TPA: glycoside hydrolase family 2 TIM barrel-domain containing protein, partial [Candidatus Acidoferrum sp.]|nr:glycoside hydrolase family 2 TIM barrel-domain containing protein [Candidatus Acidoferrum sp.]